jgi:hypothetical protein
MAERVRTGRVEAALRLGGDPWMPLLERQSPDSLAERLAEGKARHKTAFGSAPAGLVPAAGSLDAGAAKLLAAQKIAWAAVSDSSSTDAWLQDGVCVIPFRALLSTESVKLKPGEPPRAVVLDEASGALAPGGALVALASALDSGAQGRWASVSETFPPQSAPGAAPAGGWPSWAPVDDSPAAARAEALYGQAAEALARYQNSGIARIEALEKASTALRSAQSWRFHARGALDRPDTDKEYRSLLRAVFKATGQNAPAELVAASSSGAGAAAEDELGARLASGRDGSRIWFENPAKSLAQTPQPLPAGREAGDWTPRRLDVSWDANGIRVSVQTGASGEAGPPVSAAQVYIDVNHLAGRGATRLLPETQAFVRSVDGWEYALAVDADGARLWRSSPQGPVPIAELPVKADPTRSQLSAEIPRKLLRGDPSRWGYLVLTLAPVPGSPRNAPRFLAGPGGSPVLGVLGDLSEQKVLADPLSPVRRFSAVRLEKNVPVVGERP